MAYTVERVGAEPIIILTITNPIEDPIQETIDSDNAVHEAGSKIGGKYYRIANMTGMELTWDQLTWWLSEQKKSRPGSINDPNIVSYLVSDTAMTRQTAKFAKQEQYGGQIIKVFATLEDALEEARKGAELA